MTCNDFEMLRRVAEAEIQLGAFLEGVARSPTESPEDERNRVPTHS
jgi:hypothetical protein